MADTAGAPQQPAARSDGSTVVLLGNTAPMMQIDVRDPTGLTNRVASRAAHINQSTTRIVMEPDFDAQEFVERTLSTDNDRVLSLIARSLPDEHRRYAIGLSQLEQIWSVHSGDGRPAYVSSTDPQFAEAIGKHFSCDVMPYEPQMLLTNGGRDAIHAQAFGTSAQPAASNYIALTANATAAAAGDTTLTAEIATAGGGLLRAQATYAHTAGTNTTTLTKTFTANGSDSLPVTIAKIGVFNAATSGTMTFETLLNSTATLSTSGDNITVTETITAG